MNFDFKPIEISLGTPGFCLACGGTGKIKAKRMAAQINGTSITYDEIKIQCPACNGAGLMCSTSTAPRSRRAEK